MMPVPRALRILAVSGSLRRGSSNTELLRAAALLAPPGMRIIPFDGARALDVAAGHHGPVTALVFSPAGDRLLSAGDDGTLALTEVASGRVVGRARFPFDRVTSLWVSPDGAEVRAETVRGMRVRLGVGAPP